MTGGRSGAACGTVVDEQSTAACANPGTTIRHSRTTAVLRMSSTFSSVPASVGSQPGSNKPCARIFMKNVNIADMRHAEKTKSGVSRPPGHCMKRRTLVLYDQLGVVVGRPVLALVVTVVARVRGAR